MILGDELIDAVWAKGAYWQAICGQNRCAGDGETQLIPVLQRIVESDQATELSVAVQVGLNRFKASIGLTVNVLETTGEFPWRPAIEPTEILVLRPIR